MKSRILYSLLLICAILLGTKFFTQDNSPYKPLKQQAQRQKVRKDKKQFAQPLARKMKKRQFKKNTKTRPKNYEFDK